MRSVGAVVPGIRELVAGSCMMEYMDQFQRVLQSIGDVPEVYRSTVHKLVLGA